MPKFELRKIVEINGDVFYQVFKDDNFVTGSTVMAGRYPSEEDTKNAMQRAMEIFEIAVDNAGKPAVTTIITKDV